jgi:hypothetical protein
MCNYVLVGLWHPRVADARGRILYPTHVEGADTGLVLTSWVRVVNPILTGFKLVANPTGEPHTD